tara:strand:- start:108 stop:458 length:351 start_codon:yes stop_codon:yes gene_type:complete
MAKKALIHRGIIVDVVDAEFPVHEDFTWVNCNDDVIPYSHTYNAGTGAFTADPGPSMDAIRTARDSLLAASDWTQFADSQLSNSKKTEWATYRQALRDLPANTSDTKNVSWPTEPS